MTTTKTNSTNDDSRESSQLFAIADLHLPGGMNKTMEVFGPQWDHHFERIRADWLNRVHPDDVVLIPGDISWAMTMDAAKEDLMEIARLPGKKILLKGNHDFWWSSVGRLRSLLPAGMYAVQHSCVDCEEFVVCGTRGWILPGGENPMTAQDMKIYNRELQRLEMALKEARSIAQKRPVVVMMHYPPLSADNLDTGFTALMGEYTVDTAVYGHLHGPGIRTAFQGVYHDIAYHLVSCDALGFQMAEIKIAKKTEKIFLGISEKNISEIS